MMFSFTAVVLASLFYEHGLFITFLLWPLKIPLNYNNGIKAGGGRGVGSREGEG